MRPRWRAGTLASAGLTLVSAGSLATPARTGHAELAQASQPTLPAAVEEPAAKPLPKPPSFPVRGEFNWGQEGARFGAGRSGHVHAGQDVFARTGTPLVAVTDGVVVEEGNDGGRGNYMALYAPGTHRTYVYLHMNRPARVRTGRHVRSGERVGEVGCTGSCFGDHLHFEIRAGRGTEGAASDPLSALRRWAARSPARPTLPPGQH